MLELFLTGTGAMMPLPQRKLASLLIRREGRLLLIDCGEGTQVAIRESGWSLARIDAICLTHFHADHVAGLPGLLLTMGTCGRREPVTLIGPKGLQAVVGSLCVIAPELQFPLVFQELTEETNQTRFHDAVLTSFALSHIIPCYGYALSLRRPGRFDPSRALALGIPQQEWGRLQAGETVTTPQGVFAPQMVLGPGRRGIKLVYCTDTRPTAAILQHAQGADLLLCEGTYPDESKTDKAAEYGHMTFLDAARLARDAEAHALCLTHFSPSIADPAPYLPAAQAIFPETMAGHDGLRLTFQFPSGASRP